MTTTEEAELVFNKYGEHHDSIVNVYRSEPDIHGHAFMGYFAKTETGIWYWCSASFTTYFTDKQLSQLIGKLKELTGSEASPYNQNGDLVAKAGQLFRQVGWQVNGGGSDGQLLTLDHSDDPSLDVESLGGYSPIYIEVGTD